jgi:hypothetical protein
MRRSREKTERQLGALSRPVRAFSSRLALLVAVWTLGGCMVTGDLGVPTATQHWIRPPTTTANLQPMATAGQYAADPKLQLVAAQWPSNRTPNVQNAVLQTAAPAGSMGYSATPPVSWSVQASIPPAGSADAALPFSVPSAAAAPSAATAAMAAPTSAATAAPPAVAVATVPIAQIVAMPMKPMGAATRIAIGAPAAKPEPLPLPSSIPPPVSITQTAPAPAALRVLPAARAIAQSAYLPASRVIATATPTAATVRMPQNRTAAQPWQVQYPALPARAPASAVSQQKPAVVIDYSVLTTIATQPMPTFAMPARQTNGTVQQVGQVTIDYSVLQ